MTNGHARKTAPSDERRGSEFAQASEGASASLVRQTQGYPQVIGYVAKNTHERVRIALDEYNGFSYLDLRVVVQGENGSDRPTKQGCTIRPDRIHEFLRLIQHAKDEAERLGLVQPREASVHG
jgi:hypothetical protein